MQLTLPTLTPDPDLSLLFEECDKLKLHRKSPATERGYSYDWKQFTGWCERFGRHSLPATPETICLYLTHRLVRDKKKVTTVNRYASAIAHKHTQAGFAGPVAAEVKALLRGARRALCEAPRQMAPLKPDEVRQMAAALAAIGTPVGVRNRALVLIGFASALRRSNLADLDTCDIRRCPEGYIVRVRREKQDQTGIGREIAIPAGRHPETCPVGALDDWLRVRGRAEGPLFSRLDTRARLGPKRLSRNAIWQNVKEAVARIGLDPRRYGPHSLRAGLITAAGQAGCSHLIIAATSGHRSFACLQRYFRPADPFTANACSALGL